MLDVNCDNGILKPKCVERRLKGGKKTKRKKMKNKSIVFSLNLTARKIIEEDPMIKNELVTWKLQEWIPINTNKTKLYNHLG